jgi:hypothetical protein
MGSGSPLPIFAGGVYWGMRLPPLLLACALVACASAGKPGTSPEAQGTTTTPGSGLAPASFVRTTADAPATRTIEVRDGLSRQVAMRNLSEALSQRYLVDVVDPRAGFAMTTWQASLMRDGVPDPRYRTRFVARFVNEWRSLQLRSEARFTRSDEPDVGYDSAQLDSLASDLRTKLGKKP